jgi:hypothetical protein
VNVWVRSRLLAPNLEIAWRAGLGARRRMAGGQSPRNPA